MNEKYMFGSCHLFAVAMHRLTGWDLGLVVGPMGGRDRVFHVFCIDEAGDAWDVRGRHSVSDLVDEQEAMDGRMTWTVRVDGEAAIWRLAHGGDAQLNPMHESLVCDALGDVDAVVDNAAPFVSDGWAPGDADAVARAALGLGDPPAIDRRSAWDPGSAPAP